MMAAIDEITTETVEVLENDQATEESREQLLVKAKFFEEISELQKPNKIKTRAITRDQVAFLIQMLKNKNTTNNQYYYFSKKLYATASEPPQLASIDADQNAVPKIVVCLEDMFDVCYKIHAAVGYTGRAVMETESSKFFCNVTRHIIEIGISDKEKENCEFWASCKANSERILQCSHAN